MMTPRFSPIAALLLLTLLQIGLAPKHCDRCDGGRSLLRAGSIGDILKKHGSDDGTQSGAEKESERVVIGNWGRWVLIYDRVWNRLLKRKSPVCSLRVQISETPYLWVFFTRWEDDPVMAYFSFYYGDANVGSAAFSGGGKTIDLELVQGYAFAQGEHDIASILKSGSPSAIVTRGRSSGSGGGQEIKVPTEEFAAGYASLFDACQPTEAFNPGN